MVRTGTVAIHLLDLRTQQVSTLPGSQGLFSPCWSPDGRYIAAIWADVQKFMLFDFTTQQWMQLAKINVGYPSWSRDGQYIYFDTFLEREPAFFRVRASDRS